MRRGHDDADDPFHMHGALALRFLQGDIRVGEEPVGILSVGAPRCAECGLQVLVDKALPVHYRRDGTGPLCATCRERPQLP